MSDYRQVVKGLLVANVAVEIGDWGWLAGTICMIVILMFTYSSDMKARMSSRMIK